MSSTGAEVEQSELLLVMLLNTAGSLTGAPVWSVSRHLIGIARPARARLIVGGLSTGEANACTVYRVVLPVLIRYEPTVPEAVLKKRVSPVNPVSVIAPVPSSVDRFVSEPFGPLTTLTKTPPFVSCVLVPAQISVCVVPSNVE